MLLVWLELLIRCHGKVTGGGEGELIPYFYSFSRYLLLRSWYCGQLQFEFRVLHFFSLGQNLRLIINYMWTDMLIRMNSALFHTSTPAPTESIALPPKETPASPRQLNRNVEYHIWRGESRAKTIPDLNIHLRLDTSYIFYGSPLSRASSYINKRSYYSSSSSAHSKTRDSSYSYWWKVCRRQKYILSD